MSRCEGLRGICRKVEKVWAGFFRLWKPEIAISGFLGFQWLAFV